MTSYYCGRCRLPGEAHARRDISFLLKRRVVIPPHAKIQHQVLVKPPIILREYCVVIVAQMDFIGLGRESSRGGHSEEAGVDWSMRGEIIDRREQLKIEELRFNSVNMCPQKIPAELQAMLAEHLRRIG